MELYNLKDESEKVSFAQAVKQGLGRGQGLFFPREIPFLSRRKWISCWRWILSAAAPPFCMP